jgi:hypothetical protein
VTKKPKIYEKSCFDFFHRSLPEKIGIFSDFRLMTGVKARTGKNPRYYNARMVIVMPVT